MTLGAENARVAVRAPDDEAPGSRVPQLDNISLNMVAQRLGETLIAQGDVPPAAKAMRTLVEQQVARALGDGDADGRTRKRGKG